MTLWKAIILGIVQGLTEFLPVSSSGHLAIAQNLLEVPDSKVLFFTTMLHFGTLIAVFLVYGKDIIMLFKEFYKVMGEMISGKGLRLNNYHRRLGFFIILATIPTAIIGLTLKDFFESLFHMQIAIGMALLITGTLLWFAEKWNSGKKDVRDMGIFDALVVGIFQAFAIAPGISRSGSTIVGSLLMGLNKELTVKFSFLISLPAILGATIFETKDALVSGTGNISFFIICVGVLSATISGFIAIKSMISFIKREKLYYFSYYTWTIGLIIIIISLWHS